MKTNEELARELADKNNECGFIQNGLICTRPKGHTDNHRGQPLWRVIPIN